MRVLLDTHAFLWFTTADKRLSQNARDIIEDENNERLLSIASLWEMSIKASLGRLTLKLTFPEIVGEQVVGNAIELLRISAEHLDVVAHLAFHHRDPFDRMLVAQSQVEDVPIVSCDTQLDSYGIARLWDS